MPVREGEGAMSKHVFSTEVQRKLRQNPYTFRVSAKQIAFTKEFKQDFWRLYTQGGYTPEAILEMLGYDPKVFGRIRISGIQKHVKQAMESETGPYNGRRSKKRSTLSADDGYMVSDSLEEMRHEIQYLRQEVEYLKKISSIKAMKK